MHQLPERQVLLEPLLSGLPESLPELHRAELESMHRTLLSSQQHPRWNRMSTQLSFELIPKLDHQHLSRLPLVVCELFGARSQSVSHLPVNFSLQGRDLHLRLLLCHLQWADLQGLYELSPWQGCHQWRVFLPQEVQDLRRASRE